MSTLNDLRRFMAPAAPSVSGTVIERIGTDRYRISARAASIEAAAIAGAAFKLGDEVLVRGGVILGRVKPQSSVRSYTV